MKLRFRPCPKPAPSQPSNRSRPVYDRPQRMVKPTPRNKGEKVPARFKSQPGYIRCMFTLSLREYRILQICMEERGLEPGSYNAALQTILSEWRALKDQVHHPVLMAVPVEKLPKTSKRGEE